MSRVELLAPSHSVISMGDALSVSLVSCRQPRIQSKETCGRAHCTAATSQTQPSKKDMQRENFEEPSDVLVRNI